jgi:hypothetical protein
MKKKNKKKTPLTLNPEKKGREWKVFEIIGVLVGVLSIIATFVVLPWWKNYDKPILIPSFAVASIVRTNSIENDILTHKIKISDARHNNCTVFSAGYVASIENVGAPPEKIDVITFLFFENTGKSVLEDIRAGVDIYPFDTVDVSSSLNINFTYEIQEAPNGDSVVVLAIPALPPHSVALVKVTALYSEEFTKLPIFGEGPRILLTGFSSLQGGQFAGEIETLPAGEAFKMEGALFNSPEFLTTYLETNVIKAPANVKYEISESQFSDPSSSTCK